MTWRDRLQPCSFRGVPFFWVGDASGTVGRRGPLHEFPDPAGSRAPYFEDMGRSARHFALYGVTIGDNYDVDGDRLIAACEAPGAGTLTHPTRGPLQVAVMDGGCAWRESTREGGVRFFTIAFAEAGASSTAVSAAPGARVATAADAAIVAVMQAAGGPAALAGQAPRGDQ